MKKYNQCKKPSPVTEETPFFGSPASESNFFTPAVQRSPLSESVKNSWGFNGDKGAIFNILRTKCPCKDPDLENYIGSIFPIISDDWWLATTIMQYGPEPLWPHALLVERNKRSRDNNWGAEPGNIEASMGKEGKIKAYYFPGTSDRRAMIIGGVHGSERGGVEVVNHLLEIMRGPMAQMPYYSVIIVPSLFPDNVASGSRETPVKGAVDPNRQFPKVGSDAEFNADKNCTVDSTGKRCVEDSNLVLMDLVDRFKPERLASVHGHSNLDESTMNELGGPSITTDPRPGNEAEDEALALEMAKKADDLKVRVPGNKLGKKDQHVRYPNKTAKRSTEGITFGNWGSHATPTRPAMNMILIETYGNATGKGNKKRQTELESLASVLRDIFLAPPKVTK